MDKQAETSGIRTRTGALSVSAGGGRPPEDGFWSQIARCRPQLIRQALALTRDRCSAEDLVQDTLERGLQSRDKFRPGTNVGAWLGTILRNRFVDTYRQARRPVDLKDVGVLEEPTAELGPIDVFTFDDIMRALARLRPRSQEIFSWVYLQRRSYQEIAETAQIPLSTVGTRLFRVRGELRRALQKEFDRRMNGGSRREGAVAAALPRPSRPSVPYAMAMCGPRSSRAVVFAAAV